MANILGLAWAHYMQQLGKKPLRTKVTEAHAGRRKNFEAREL